MATKRYSSLENALRLLDCFTIGNPEHQVKELAEGLGIAPSTVHRLLTTLRSEGIVVKDTFSNQYRLGISIRSLEAVIKRNMPLYGISQIILDQATARTKLSASLVVEFQGSAFYLYTTQTEEHYFLDYPYVEKTCPIMDTGAGKVIIAGNEEAEGPPALQDPSARSSLRSELKENGYLLHQHDQDFNIVTAAVPIKDQEGRVIAAIEFMGREKRVIPKIYELIVAGERISDRISAVEAGIYSSGLSD